MTVASAIAAWAVPPRDVARFKTLDAFAQALSTVQTSYVDPTDEKQLIYNAARGMLHNLDQYSTFLPPSRYKNLRQDTEGEFGGVTLEGEVLLDFHVDDKRHFVTLGDAGHALGGIDDMLADIAAAVAKNLVVDGEKDVPHGIKFQTLFLTSGARMKPPDFIIGTFWPKVAFRSRFQMSGVGMKDE